MTLGTLIRPSQGKVCLRELLSHLQCTYLAERLYFLLLGDLGCAHQCPGDDRCPSTSSDWCLYSITRKALGMAQLAPAGDTELSVTFAKEVNHCEWPGKH